MSDERDRVLNQCAKLKRLLVATQAPRDTIRVGQIQDMAEASDNVDQLVSLSHDLRDLTNPLWHEGDGHGGMVLNRDRHKELLDDDPLCPTHNGPMESACLKPLKKNLYSAVLIKRAK